MNREIKTIQREKPHIKNNEPINENNINIDINFADKEKEHLKEMVQQFIPIAIEPIEDIEEETDEDIEMDNLINDLENTIKEFIMFKEALSQRNINIPNNLLEIPDIDIKEKQDIINLISILKNRIDEFKNILRTSQIQTPQPSEPILQKPINQLTQPTPLRARKDFMPIMQPSRIRPSYYGDDNIEDARHEVNDTKNFISNRDIYNSNNIELINRAILRINRNTRHIDTLLLDETNTPRENILLRDLHKQLQGILNKLENKKIDLTGKPRPDEPIPEERPEERPEEERPEEFIETEPIPFEDDVRPEEEPIPYAPQRSMGKTDEMLILELQDWLQKYESKASNLRVLRAQKNLKEAQDRLSGMGDDQIPEDESLDQLDRQTDARVEQLRNYINKITSTGRSQTSVATIRNRIEEMINDIISHRDRAEPYQLRTYITNRNLYMDRANGDFPTALAFENIGGEIRNIDRELGGDDIIRLVPTDMTKIRQEKPNARQIFYLEKNGKRLISNSTSLNPTERDLRSRFTEDGDYYRSKDLDEFIETEPIPEEPTPEEPTPDEPIHEEVNPRDTQLLNYRNNLYYTSHNQNIINQLDQQIGSTIGTENLIILDRTNNNLPATIAYLHLPIKRIIEENIESAELRQIPRNQLQDEHSNDAFLLYINGNRQDSEYNQQMLFNEYGDQYSIEDQSGRIPQITYPFRPTGRVGLSVPEPAPEPAPAPPTDYFDPDEYDESIGMIEGRDPSIPLPPPPIPEPIPEQPEQPEPHSSIRPDYSAIYGSRANTGQSRGLWDTMRNVLGFGEHLGEHQIERGSLTTETIPQQDP